MKRIGDIIEFVLSVYLVYLFKFPTNIYLQKFDILVWFWSIFVFCITIIGFLGFLAIPDYHEIVKKELQKKQLLGHITTIILLFLLILNDFYFCFVIYMISYLIGFFIRSLLQEKKTNKTKDQKKELEEK